MPFLDDMLIADFVLLCAVPRIFTIWSVRIRSPFRSRSPRNTIPSAMNSSSPCWEYWNFRGGTSEDFSIILQNNLNKTIVFHFSWKVLPMGSKSETSKIYSTISVLLAEKRTSLAVLRTAIAIFTLPISVFTVLIATSRYYDVSAVLHFIIPLLTICAILVFLGTYFVYRSFKKIKRIDHTIREIKMKEEHLHDILED